MFWIRPDNTPGPSLQLLIATRSYKSTSAQTHVCLASTTFIYTSVTSGFRQDGHVFRGHSDLAQLCDFGPQNYSTICTQCVSESACDSELLFNMIVHLGSPGARQIVQLLVVTSVLSGSPGAMGPTLSSTHKLNHNVSESACDGELLFNMIDNLGSHGSREFVQLLDVTSVSSGNPGAMGPTLSSSHKPNHHDGVD